MSLNFESESRFKVTMHDSMLLVFLMTIHLEGTYFRASGVSFMFFFSTLLLARIIFVIHYVLQPQLQSQLAYLAG